MVRTPELQRRVDRHLVKVTVATAAVASLVLALVVALVERESNLQLAQNRADTIERQLLEQITTGQSLAQVRRSLQISAAANRVAVGLLVNRQGRVIAANDGALVGERFERSMLTPIRNAAWDGIWPCLVSAQRRWHHSGCRQPFGQFGGDWTPLGGSRWISVARTPLALDGQPGLDQGGLLVLSVDLVPSLQRAVLDGLITVAAGLLLLLASNGGLVLVLRHQLVRRLVKLARIDSTTGLLNREAWMEDMTVWLKEQEAQRQPVLLAIAGLDHFKEINSQHGYPEGDRLLRQLSRLLRRSLHHDDWLARLSGDQFVVCIRGGTAHIDRFRQLCQTVAGQRWPLEPGQEQGPWVVLTLSIGVSATTGPAGWTLNRLMAQADHNLRLAKQQGGNQVVCR